MKDDENLHLHLTWRTRLLMRPEEYKRFAWEMFIMSILIIFGFLIPYIGAFEQENVRLSMSIDIFSIIIFTIDIIINFNTGFYRKGILVMDRAQIFKNYISFWFWLDLISTVPLDWILEPGTSLNAQQGKLLKYLRVFRVLKLLKLVRLTKLKLMIIKIMDRISNKKLISLISALRLLLYIFLIANFFACLMYSVSAESMEPDTFINLIVNKSEKPIGNGEMYLSCFYWAIVTMTSIGYGDYSPRTTIEKIFGVFTMMISSGMFGFIIGNMGTIVEKHSLKERIKREAIVQLNMFMKKHKFNLDLEAKTRKYMEYVLKNDKNNDIKLNELLNNLSHPLQEEIMMHTNGFLLKKCPIFNIFTGTFVNRIARMLETKIFSPGDSIIKEGLPSTGMHFINKGIVEIFDNITRYRIQVLAEGDYFGEIGLFTNQNCTASAVALSFTDTFHLCIIKFHLLIDRHPKIKSLIGEIKESCVEGNYTALKICCYLCKNYGHIAKNCNEIMNDERVKNIWVTRREISKRVNMNQKHKNKYIRKKAPKVHRKDYSAKNVLGNNRKPRQLFKGTPSLFKGIIRYIKRRNEVAKQMPEGLVLFTEESSILSNNTGKSIRCPDLVLSSDEENEKEALVQERDLSFDILLLK